MGIQRKDFFSFKTDAPQAGLRQRPFYAPPPEMAPVSRLRPVRARETGVTVGARLENKGGRSVCRRGGGASGPAPPARRRRRGGPAELEARAGQDDGVIFCRQPSPTTFLPHTLTLSFIILGLGIQGTGTGYRGQLHFHISASPLCNPGFLVCLMAVAV